MFGRACVCVCVLVCQGVCARACVHARVRVVWAILSKRIGVLSSSSSAAACVCMRTSNKTKKEGSTFSTAPLGGSQATGLVCCQGLCICICLFQSVKEKTAVVALYPTPQCSLVSKRFDFGFI